MKIRPLHDRIVVRRVDAETTSAGGIIIPDNAREKPVQGEVIAVGDGANDLPMISIAGLGIAFHAKSVVKENAQRSISSVGLDGLLYLMGISEREIRQP